MNSGKKLRSAVVGVGYLGTFHAQKHKNNPNVELVGVCDFSPAQADKVAAELGVASFHKASDLLGHVDLVTISASTQSHYELAKMFIDGGVHVNIEKPITATVEQAQELLALAAQKKVLVAVGHIERFNPCILDLREKMKSGTTRSVELTRYAPFKARGADVSVLHDLMIHDLDLLYWLANSEVESFEASGSILITKELDVASASFRMKNGILGLIKVSRVSPTAERSIRVVQDEALYFANTGALEIEKVSPGSDLNTDALKVEKWTVTKEDALQKEEDAFIQAVLQNSKPAVTGEDGLKALLGIAQIESAILKTGKKH